MSAASEKLYEEFLDNYQLEHGLYNHVFEIMDNPLEKLDEVKVVYLGDTMVPATPAVQNSIKFRKQLNLAPYHAELELKKYIGSYKGCVLDEDDVNLFCYTVEEMVLRHLLWPFHLITNQADLIEKQFYPLAHMMETEVVQKVFDALYDFNQGVLAHNRRIDEDMEDEVERMKRQTDRWAANAPVEVSGTIRRVGRHLEVEATARSTVTDGMINAEYQAHNLVAGMSANREKVAVHRELMNTLESKLLSVTGIYLRRFYDCLSKMGDIIGTNLLRDTLCTDKKNFRPHERENIIQLIEDAPYETDFYQLAYLLRCYDHDFSDLFGTHVAITMFNDYIRNKKIDEEDFYYKFFAYFYDLEHPIQHEGLFLRFKHKLCEQIKKHCEKIKATRPEVYTKENAKQILVTPYRMAQIIPGLDEAHKKNMIDACHEIYDKLL